MPRFDKEEMRKFNAIAELFRRLEKRLYDLEARVDGVMVTQQSPKLPDLGSNPGVPATPPADPATARQILDAVGVSKAHQETIIEIDEDGTVRPPQEGEFNG